MKISIDPNFQIDSKKCIWNVVKIKKKLHRREKFKKIGLITLKKNIMV